MKRPVAVTFVLLGTAAGLAVISFSSQRTPNPESAHELRAPLPATPPSNASAATSPGTNNNGDRPMGQAIALPATSQLAKSLEKLVSLSQVVLPTRDKLRELKQVLDDPGLAAAIQKTLSDPASYQGEAFHQKLRLLDALYEGLKFPEAELSGRYFQLATDILAERPPESYAQNHELNRQFIADRTEIAIALLKSFPEQGRALEDKISKQSDAGRAAFQNARRLMGTYEVAI